jgi:hypothetical protein
MLYGLLHWLTIDIVQVHVLPELRALAKEFEQPLHDADGIAEVWVDNVEAWKEVISDPEFVEKILRMFTLRY